MGRRKQRHNGARICQVCQTSYPLRSHPVQRCSYCDSKLRHAICDSCFSSYIITAMSQGTISSSIVCPEEGCNAEISEITIHTELVKSGRVDLWNSYSSKFNCCDTSQHWIKRFAVRCPGCRVPIEKNGGCDRMVCTRCRLSFSWQRAKTWGRLDFQIWMKVYKHRIALFLYLALFLVFMLCCGKFLLLHTCI